MPFTTFQRAFNRGNAVGWYAITARPGILASVAEDRVLDLLRRRLRVAPDDARALGHFNAETEYLRVSGLFTSIRLLIWIVGIGTLAAGVIGVSNIMLVIVRERTQEIGIRRAVGATPWSILAQIVLEALILTSIAGYVGLILGMGAIEGTRVMLAGAETGMFRDPDVGVRTALRALGILIAAGVFAGLIPARRAVRIRPVEALRGMG